MFLTIFWYESYFIDEIIRNVWCFPKNSCGTYQPILLWADGNNLPHWLFDFVRWPIKAQCSSFSSGSFWIRSLFSCSLRFLYFEQVFSKWAAQIDGGIFNFFCPFIFVCRTLISRLSLAGFAILDGAGWTAADTGHTMGAAVAPGRCSVFHLDVAQRTGFLTSALTV